MIRLGAVVVFLLCAWSALTTSAQARTVTCGEKITTSVVLSNDLVDCPGDGLEVGASGITIDLNGHSIDAADELGGGGRGVAIQGFDNVRVRNGTIKGFFFGVEVLFASGARVEHLYTVGNQYGISAGAGSSRSRVAFNVSADQSAGLFAESDSSATTFSRNFVLSGPIGLSIGFDTTGVRADRNTFSTDRGIFVGGTDASITSNTVTATTAGIEVDAAQAFIASNTVRGAREVLPGSTGIVVHGSGAFIAANSVRGFADDGIRANFATLTHNRTVANGDLGIQATGQVIDGGGNRAKLNGNPLQCVGVTCRS